MKPRYFHLYSDYKTIKEIDWDTYRNAPRTWRLMQVRAGEIFLAKAGRYFFLPRVQLDKVLETIEQ